jgi:hypothetical protein
VAMREPPQADADAIAATQAAILTRWATSIDIDNGFAPVSIGSEYVLLPGSHWPDAPKGVREATVADRFLIETLQARRASGLAGVRVRDQVDWQGRIWPCMDSARDMIIAIHEGPDGPDGYLMATVSQGAEPHVTVNEWVELTCEARRDLLHALLALGGPGATVRIPPMPTDVPWHQLVEGFPLTTRVIRTSEWRAGAVVPFLAAMRYQAGSGRLRLGVRDPLGVWPPCVEMAWADGRCIGAATSPGAPEVSMAIDTLLLIAIGELSVAEADYLGRLDGDAAAKASLGRIWKKQTIDRYWDDLRLTYELNCLATWR